MPPRKTRASKKAEEAIAVKETAPPPVLEEEKDASVKDTAAVEEVGEVKQTMEERMQKMKELRKKMTDSSMANRRAVATELNRHKQNAKHQNSLQRKMDKAEKVLDQRDALENGEDWERAKAWGYTIEENERWEEKLEKKEDGKDRGAIDPNSAAERSYRRRVQQIKPDMKAYASQKSIAGSSSPSASLVAAPDKGSSQVLRRDDLANSSSSALTYGEHKPDDAALDRVSSHLNEEAIIRTKHSRRRPDDGDAEVNYINDKNKHYNKKIARFYDKYTTEIRENCEIARENVRELAKTHVGLTLVLIISCSPVSVERGTA
ncbi:hypothetical protein CBS101457_006000 [Exobasidium rhododendri]|nr:hypothetical protein CBS101457_006000 [Exobasidium rhododendri]